MGKQWLTKQGLNDALKYGEDLKHQNVYFDEIISSPIKRCMQTAEKIIEGLGYNIKIQKSHLLGDPGIFITDAKKAAEVFDKFSVCEVINFIIKREKILGFLLIDKACIPMINNVQRKIALNKSILYISHDVIIMPFIAYISEIKVINESDIINYLGAYVLEKSDNKGLRLTAKKLLSDSETTLLAASELGRYAVKK